MLGQSDVNAVCHEVCGSHWEISKTTGEPYEVCKARSVDVVEMPMMSEHISGVTAVEARCVDEVYPQLKEDVKVVPAVVYVVSSRVIKAQVRGQGVTLVTVRHDDDVNQAGPCATSPSCRGPPDADDLDAI